MTTPTLSTPLAPGYAVHGEQGGTGLDVSQLPPGQALVVSSDSKSWTTQALPAGSGTVTEVSVVTANGFAGSVFDPHVAPAITMQTTISGILKGAANAITSAVSGTDYAPATTGGSILYADGAGGFLPVTIGANMFFVAGVLSAAGGGGGTPGGSNGQIQYNNAGAFGGVSTSGSGLVALTTGATLTSPVLVTPALGTPASGVATNLTGTAAGLTAGNVTTNANLTGPITSVGNATAIASQTGAGTKFVMDTSPTLVTPVLGVATATSINKMSVTAPASASTLAVADGKTFTASATLTLAGVDGKTLTVNKSLTLDGTDGTVMTFPATNATIARTDAAQSFTGAQTFTKGIFNGTGALAALVAANITELMSIIAAAPSSTQTFYAASGSVQYYTTNAANNWTVNFAWSAGTSANAQMAIGDSVTVVMLTTQGGTAFYNTAFQVDGNAVTPKWSGGVAPTAGNVSGLDSYTYTIIKTANATFTVLAQQTQYK